MTTSGDYIMIFLMGLFGSLHCLGMCGGLMGACSIKFGNGKFAFTLFYNIGRVLTYISIGVVMGLFGMGVLRSELFIFRDILPIVVGLVMIGVGLDMVNAVPARLKHRLASILPRRAIDGFITRRLKAGRSPALFLGALNGLVPCGLVYAAAMKASTMGGIVPGALVMAALGVGTLLPLLFVGALTTNKHFLKRRRLFNTLSAIVLIALGVKALYFVLVVSGAHAKHVM